MPRKKKLKHWECVIREKSEINDRQKRNRKPEKANKLLKYWKVKQKTKKNGQNRTTDRMCARKKIAEDLLVGCAYVCEHGCCYAAESPSTDEIDYV